MFHLKDPSSCQESIPNNKIEYHVPELQNRPMVSNKSRDFRDLMVAISSKVNPENASNECVQQHGRLSPDVLASLSPQQVKWAKKFDAGTLIQVFGQVFWDVLDHYDSKFSQAAGRDGSDSTKKAQSEAAMQSQLSATMTHISKDSLFLGGQNFTVGFSGHCPTS